MKNISSRFFCIEKSRKYLLEQNRKYEKISPRQTMRMCCSIHDCLYRWKCRERNGKNKLPFPHVIQFSIYWDWVFIVGWIGFVMEILGKGLRWMSRCSNIWSSMFWNWTCRRFRIKVRNEFWKSPECKNWHCFVIIWGAKETNNIQIDARDNSWSYQKIVNRDVLFVQHLVFTSKTSLESRIFLCKRQ